MNEKVHMNVLISLWLSSVHLIYSKIDIVVFVFTED